LKVLATYNIKGGVGKTASAVNLAYCAFKDNLRVLVWDLDPQGAATYYFRIKPKVKAGARTLVSKVRTINNVIKATNFDGLDLLPADFSNRNMDIYLNDEKKSDLRFRKIVSQIAPEYDLLIIDCPPSISLVSKNVFFASDCLLIPTIPTHLSFRAYDQLKRYINKHEEFKVTMLPYLYMVDRRKSIHKQFSEKFLNTFPEGLESQISYSSIVEKMGIYRAPVEIFDTYSGISTDFNKLWKEIYNRII